MPNYTKPSIVVFRQNLFDLHGKKRRCVDVCFIWTVATLDLFLNAPDQSETIVIIH